MGCNHGKTSQPTAKPGKVGSESTVKPPSEDTQSAHGKSLTLLGSEDASSMIKDPKLNSPTAMKTVQLSDAEAETNETHETLAGSTSTEPESEMPTTSERESPRCADAIKAPEQGAATSCAADDHTEASAKQGEQDHLGRSSSSEPSIHGSWNVGTIVGTRLTFKSSGETVDLQIVHPKECRMTWKGVKCIGVLRGDGKLQWSDGDVWSREQPAPVQSVQSAASLAKEEKLRKETLLRVAEQNNRSLNFSGTALTTAEDVRRAGEAAAAARIIKADVSGHVNREEKAARKERQSCCC